MRSLQKSDSVEQAQDAQADAPEQAQDAQAAAVEQAQETQAATPEQAQEAQAATPEQAPLEPNDVNAKTLTQLNTLMEESLQIYELEDQKTNVIDDLHTALQVITEFLGFSTNVHPRIFNLPDDATVTMLPNLSLIIKLVNGKTETKKFTDYNPETITAIVEYVTPILLELIQAQKSYLTEKITFLRTATKQLSTLSQLKENLPSIVVPSEET